MKEVYNQYKKIVKDFLNNKLYMYSIIIITILSFGFYITNYSIGVDDFSQDRYITGNYLLSQGRWGNVLFARLFNVVQFVPFWNELVSVVLLIIMSIIISAFIKKEMCNIIDKTIYYILLSCMIISYPIIHHIFLYDFANVITVFSNLAMIIFAIMLYESVLNIQKNKLPYWTYCIIFPFFISMYEASCQTFLIFTFIIAFIRLYTKEEKTLNIIKYILISTTILMFSIIINVEISSIIKYILSITGNLTVDFSRKHIPWLSNSFMKSLGILKLNVIDVYLTDINNLYYIATFFVISTIAIFISINQSIKKKNIMYVLLMISIVMLNFIFNLLQLEVLYRTCAAWSISIAFMTLYILLSNKNNLIINNTLIAIFILMILINSRTMTQFFYNDNIRYEREKNIAYDIANTIVRTCDDPTKPLVYFPCMIEDVQGNSINLDNGWPVLRWGVTAFLEHGTEITKFINSLGYKFNCATNEKAEKAYQEFSKVKDVYEKDIIIEFDNYIIVKVIYEHCILN